MPLPEGLRAWFGEAQRLTIRFRQSDVLDTQERTHTVSCHLLEDLANVEAAPAAMAKSASTNSLSGAAGVQQSQEPQVITFLHGYPGCRWVSWHGDPITPCAVKAAHAIAAPTSLVLRLRFPPHPA
jgi:hypothetical protein